MPLRVYQRWQHDERYELVSQCAQCTDLRALIVGEFLFVVCNCISLFADRRITRRFMFVCVLVSGLFLPDYCRWFHATRCMS